MQQNKWFLNKKAQIIKNCKLLLEWYKKWELGYMKMPEDKNPWLDKMSLEEKLVYFTLPMSLNYQRNSYTLWESVLKTYKDKETKEIFDIKYSASLSEKKLREKLLKYKIALQPNKHIKTWLQISKTVFNNWWTLTNLFEYCDYDFLKLKEVFQKKYKKWFPYISWPKIFNYWCSILENYTWIKLQNKEFIEIAVDTHVMQGSIKLWIVKEEEKALISKEEIHKRWRELLKNTWITPAEMHSPLWFWSRNNFKFKIKLWKH